MQSLKWLAKALAMVVCLGVFLAAGKLLQASFSLPFPGAIIGMILLVIALIVIGRIPNWLSDPVDRLLPHLSLFFIPAIVGVTQIDMLDTWGWLLLIAYLLVSWLLSLIVVTLILQRAIKETN
jgi:holin-like protein